MISRELVSFLTSRSKEARRRYETNYRICRHKSTKVSLGFWQLVEVMLKVYEDPDFHLEQVAQEINVSRQRVSQLFKKYLASFLPPLPDKLVIIQERSRRWRREAAWSFLKKWFFHQRLISEAEEAGYPAQLVFEPSSSEFRRHALWVNGDLCGLHSITTACRTVPDGPVYASLSLTRQLLERHGAEIVDVKPKNGRQKGLRQGLLILPARLLLSRMGRRKSADFYIPLEKRKPRRQKRSQMNLWKYENGWRKVFGQPKLKAFRKLDRAA